MNTLHLSTASPNDNGLMVRIDHFTFVCFVTWSLSGSKAGGDLVLTQSSLLLLRKSSFFLCYLVGIQIRKAESSVLKKGHLQPRLHSWSDNYAHNYKMAYWEKLAQDQIKFPERLLTLIAWVENITSDPKLLPATQRSEEQHSSH